GDARADHDDISGSVFIEWLLVRCVCGRDPYRGCDPVSETLFIVSNSGHSALQEAKNMPALRCCCDPFFFKSLNTGLWECLESRRIATSTYADAAGTGMFG